MPIYEAMTHLVAFDGFTKAGGFRHAPLESLRLLDGLDYTAEDFVHEMEEPLASFIINSNGIKLSLDEANCQLTAVSHFESTRELNEQEIALLKHDYDAQMSDGIGENFFSEIQSRPDVQFRLELYWLYETDRGSKLRLVTSQPMHRRGGTT